MATSLKKILELMKEKYPGYTALLIFDDESGRVTGNPEEPYVGNAYVYFKSIDDLVKQLKETE